MASNTLFGNSHKQIICKQNVYVCMALLRHQPKQFHEPIPLHTHESVLLTSLHTCASLLRRTLHALSAAMTLIVIGIIRLPAAPAHPSHAAHSPHAAHVHERVAAVPVEPAASLVPAAALLSRVEVGQFALFGVVGNDEFGARGETLLEQVDLCGF